MFLSPLVALVLGGALSLNAVRRRALMTVLVAVLGTALAGVAIGVQASLVRFPRHTFSLTAEGGALLGLQTSLAFLPVVLCAALLGRRVGRARAGSIVDDHDVRRIFGLVAFAVAIGAPIVAFAGDRAPRFSVDTSRALGAVATLVLCAFVLFDALSYIRVRRAMFDVVEMRQANPRAVSVENVVDVGIGDVAYEKLTEAGSAYRTNQLPLRAILGEPNLAVDAVRGGLAQSIIMVTLSIAATALNL